MSSPVRQPSSPSSVAARDATGTTLIRSLSRTAAQQNSQSKPNSTTQEPAVEAKPAQASNGAAASSSPAAAVAPTSAPSNTNTQNTTAAPQNTQGQFASAATAAPSSAAAPAATTTSPPRQQQPPPAAAASSPAAPAAPAAPAGQSQAPAAAAAAPGAAAGPVPVKLGRIARFREKAKPKLKKIGAKLDKVYIQPEHKFRIFFYVVIVIVFLYNAISVPYRACYESFTAWPFRVFDVIADLLFFANIPLMMISTTDIGVQRYSSRKKAIRAGWFKWLVDLLSICPIDYILPHPAWRLFRLLQTWRGFSYYGKIVQVVSFINPMILRIFSSVLQLGILMHIFSCFWFLIGKQFHMYVNFITPSDGGQLFLQIIQAPPGDWSYTWIRFRQYMASLYFGTLQIVGAASVLPQDILQVIFSLLIGYIGLFFFATIVGTVGSLINSLDQTESKFKEKMDQIKSYMRFKKISTDLVQDVNLFYSTLQSRKMGLDQDDVMGELDPSIEREMAKYMHKELVNKVELFRNMGELFIDDICTCLKYTLLLKGYHIIRQGEIGREMYFLGSGSVDVVLPDGTLLSTIQKGGFFGEGALLSGQRRGANIVAKEMCELYLLTKFDFETIMSKHPDARAILQETLRKRNEAAAAARQSPIVAAANAVIATNRMSNLIGGSSASLHRQATASNGSMTARSGALTSRRSSITSNASAQRIASIFSLKAKKSSKYVVSEHGSNEPLVAPPTARGTASSSSGTLPSTTASAAESQGGHASNEQAGSAHPEIAVTVSEGDQKQPEQESHPSSPNSAPEANAQHKEQEDKEKKEKQPEPA